MSVATKRIKVRVANGDLGEDPGHTIQLAVGGDCPAGTVVGLPDFGKHAAVSSDTVELVGGGRRTATVNLNIDSAAFTTFNAAAPARCTLVFTATTVAPTNWYEPTPANNRFSVELNVVDENDAGQTTVHESVVKSVPPLRLVLRKGATTRVKNGTVKVVNADILPTAEQSGDLIGLTVTDSDCPAGVLGAIDFGGGQSGAAVKGGATRAATLPLTITAAEFTSPSAASPARCTVELTEKGPSYPEPDSSNDVTRLVIDVIDRNDF